MVNRARMDSLGWLTYTYGSVIMYAIREDEQKQGYHIGVWYRMMSLRRLNPLNSEVQLA